MIKNAMKKAPLKTISFYDINDLGLSADALEWIWEILGPGTFKVREVAMALEEEDEANLNILKQYEGSDNVQISESW